MGAVKVMLSEKKLKDRERHNSRLFVDLCENIHIHYREYRFVFSLPEYFEFIDIVTKSTEDVQSYLAQNADYEEMKYKTTLMVAGGKYRQMKFLENSPQPNKSAYFDDSLRIELQEEYITDEIHIHYRDFRLALNRENFKDIARSFVEALDNLEGFEAEHDYQRLNHDDRDINDWSQDDAVADSDTDIMGAYDVDVSRIKSKWHSDVVNDWSPDPKAIESIKQRIRAGASVAPIVVVREGDDFYVVDGHHRLRAQLELDCQKVKAVIVKDLSWESTQALREAEVKLKQFDKETGYKYNLSSFYQRHVSNSLNNYYRDNFHNLIKEPSAFYKLLKGVKSVAMKLPLGERYRNFVFNLSGSKKYWR